MLKRSWWPWMAAFGAVVLVLAPAAVSGSNEPHAFAYKVTITDLTHTQPLTPPIWATSPNSGYIFSVGSAASPGLQQVAENGNNNPLQFQFQTDRLNDRNTDYGVVVSNGTPPGPLVPPQMPGSALFPGSVSFKITAHPGDSLSWVAMLICTNDGFTGVRGLELPTAMGKSVSVDSITWDAGTELNTQKFADMVPGCQHLSGTSAGVPGTGTTNPALAEHGVIHTHAGIISTGDLTPAGFGWSEPVARTTIERIG